MTALQSASIIHFDPKKGEVLKTIHMPTPQVTSITFGNDKLNILYVTTAKLPIDGKIPDEPAGCTFKLENVHIKGAPGYSYKYKDDDDLAV